jgi:lipopolysaccharide/colanic/teichoic acid biosynthesis glycosyltransferase
MNSRADSLPPFAVGLVAVALATSAVLLPDLAVGQPGRGLHVTVADAVFSAVLAVCWLYAASWTQIRASRVGWFQSSVRMIQGYSPVVALFVLYMSASHPNLSGFRTTAVFLLCIVLGELVRGLTSGLSRSGSRRALVLGTGRVATTVWRDLRTGRIPKMTFAGFTSEGFNEEFCPDIAARYVGTLSELKSIVLRQSVDDLIIATPAAEGSRETEDAVQVAATLGVRVWTVKQVLGLGYATGDAATEYIELVGDPDLSAFRRIVKRSVDVILSTLALVAGLPVAVLTLLRRVARGEQLRLECQSRVGRRRRLFRVHRVHSSYRSDWLHEWMNKYLLMWNVLRGDMSMVGPRALSPEELAEHEVPESAGRFGIRPGLTGGREFERDRKSSSAARKPGNVYTEHWSLIRDLVVLARAFRAFVQRHGVTHAETGAA